MRKLIVLLTLLGGGTLSLSEARASEADKKMPPGQSNIVGHWIRRLGGSDENERSHLSVRQAFREVVEPASHSTVRVLCDGLQVSLGMIVREDGYIIAKASEISSALSRPGKSAKRLECILSDSRRLVADPLSRHEPLDLMLLKIEAAQLPVVQWSEAPAPPVGSWLATPGIDHNPMSIGVVGLLPHAVPTSRTILGLGALDQVDRGVRVNHILPGTGAALAGLRPGDVIASINGRNMDSPSTLTDLIRRLQPGEKVTLAVVRDAEQLSLVATLGDALHVGQQEQAELMDSLGGPLSRRRTGFSSVFQHDSILRPRDCGGPVVDLDGKAVGINIARASRVATYAVPARVARPAVAELLARALPDVAKDQNSDTVPVTTGTGTP